MIIGRQILKSDPTYPNDDPEVTHENIKQYLHRIGMFDISGYGFQYPRQLLSIVSQEICNLFPSPDIWEMDSIFQRILSTVKVQMPDGKFVYPPRGIGLGYYEDLKTIGMNAILKPFKPTSVYGDQGLINPWVLKPSIDSLREYGFIIKDHKFSIEIGSIKWSGWHMNQHTARRPKQLLEPLVSAFKGQYHWERKNILRNFYNEFPSFYNSIDMILPFQYELLFGYEFQRGDSLWNFENSGVSSQTALSTGRLKTWQVQNLTTPRDQIIDSCIYETPFFTEWKRADCKAFSIKRKAMYKNSRPSSTEIFDYVNPKLTLNLTKKPILPKIASLISDSAESKLIINHKQSTGKFLFGLNTEGVVNALKYCSRARNPYEAYATGGYAVRTVWRGEPLVSSEQTFLSEYILAEIDQMSKFITTRLDVQDFNFLELFPHSSSKRRLDVQLPTGGKALTNILKKPKYTKVSMSDMIQHEFNRGHNREDELAQGVVTLLQDITNRSLNLVDVSDVEEEIQDFDEGLYLTDSSSDNDSD